MGTSGSSAMAPGMEERGEGGMNGRENRSRHSRGHHNGQRMER
jgi:hypothetical protein